MVKKIIPLLPLFFLLFTLNVNAQESSIYKAEVIKIIEESNNQQNIKLKILEGDLKDEEVIYYGIDNFEVINQNYYKEKDIVLISKTYGPDNTVFYDITDFVRTNYLLYLGILFILLTIVIAKFKGLRALLSLLFSFLIIMKFIIPNILEGHNPLLIAILGSFFILLFIIYLTEGFNRKSNLAIISIIISLILTGLLAVLFTNLTRLTGFSSEDSMFLVSVVDKVINFKGLLLAGIIIGTLGVLDDMVLSQISSVEEIKRANKNLSNREVYKSGINIGKSHLGSMVNTLFLAYVGVSLPLIILFSVQDISLFNVINNEIISTEIIRTLIGSIGLVLAVPISTYLAVKYIKI